MKIEILIPVALPENWRKVAVARYAKYASPSTVLHGTDFTGLLEGGMNYSQAPRLVLRNALKVEENGADACIINCFTDPALGECSSRLEIPKKLEETMSRLLTAAKKLLGKTSTFVMGCAELAEMARPLCQELHLLEAKSQVINPIGAATRLAETRVMLGNACPGKGRLSDLV